MLTWDPETRRHKNTCSVFVCPSPGGINAASENEMTGASSDFKDILNMGTNKYCSNLVRIWQWDGGGGLGENPDQFLFFECVTLCGLTGDRNNGEHSRDKKCDEGKTTYLLDGKPHMNKKEEAKGHTDEDEMRK